METFGEANRKTDEGKSMLAGGLEETGAKGVRHG